MAFRKERTTETPYTCLRMLQTRNSYFQRFTQQISPACLRPDEATTKRIKARLQAVIVPHYLARINRSRSKKQGQLRGNKQWMPEEEHGNVVRTLLKSGGKRMKSTEILSKPMDGRKNVADTIRPKTNSNDFGRFWN